VSFELWVTLGVCVGAILLFVSETIAIALVSLIVMCVLALAGVVTTQEALAGLSNPATVTVAAMFVLSGAVRRSGALETFASALSVALRNRPATGMAMLLGGAAVASAFVNNTAVVVVMMPLVISAAHRAEISPSRLLIPLSFASMLGGTCTLVGTSTNLLVDAMGRQQGLAPLRMFEMAPVGGVMTLVGCGFLMVVGGRLLPRHRGNLSSTDTFELRSYLLDIRIPDHPDWVGQAVGDVPALRTLDFNVLALVGRDREHVFPSDRLELRAGDVLRLHCARKDVVRLASLEELEIVTEELGDLELDDDDAVFVEAVVTPDGGLDGRTIVNAELRRRYDAVVLALRHHGELRRTRLTRARLRGGDVLLMRVARAQLPRLRATEEFALVTQAKLKSPRRRKAVLSIGILVAVIFVASMGWAPIPIAATTGAIMTVLSGCLRFDEAVAAVRLRIVLLLAGLLALAQAMQTSGAVALAAESVGALVVNGGPHLMVASLYVVTVLLTSVVSNSGTAAVLTPIAIGLAMEAGVDPKPLVMTVAFGASTSFLTPVGYQTNTLVYNAGQYRFMDFVRVGGPLTLLMLGVVTVVIPLMWPP